MSPQFTKKGDKSDPSNYRPISLTCVLCKILEHIVASSLVKHFTELDIFYEMQHGFREKRSFEMQLIMLIDKLAKNMQMGKQTDLILLDFSKAFDKVAHEKLLLKLHHYGIRGDTLKWIKDFFYLSIYLYCITPSRRLRAGARQCGVSGRNAFKNKKFP